jgi:hypothetical protein
MTAPLYHLLIFEETLKTSFFRFDGERTCQRKIFSSSELKVVVVGEEDMHTVWSYGAS